MGEEGKEIKNFAPKKINPGTATAVTSPIWKDYNKDSFVKKKTINIHLNDREVTAGTLVTWLPGVIACSPQSNTAALVRDRASQPST